MATTLEEDALLFEEESREAFELVEHLYKEWAFKLGVSEKV